MTERPSEQPENSEKTPRIDWEWEYKKLQGRIDDVLDMINDIKAKIRSNSARISRLRQEFKYGEGDEGAGEEGEDWPEPSGPSPTLPSINLHEIFLY